VLVLVGLYLVLALEASERRRGRAVLSLCIALLVVYALVLAGGGTRDFFELVVPDLWDVVAILGGAGLAVAGLVFTDQRFVPRV
jgi:drug/metabolite transporter (DMT)-like permease